MGPSLSFDRVRWPYGLTKSHTPVNWFDALDEPAPSARLLFCEPARPSEKVEPCCVVWLTCVDAEPWSLPLMIDWLWPPEAAPAEDCCAVRPKIAEALDPCDPAIAVELDCEAPEPTAIPKSMANAGVAASVEAASAANAKIFFMRSLLIASQTVKRRVAGIPLVVDGWSAASTGTRRAALRGAYLGGFETAANC